MNRSKWSFIIGGPCLLAIVWLGTTGCRSFNGTSSGSLASVTITNRSLADVSSAVTKVFTANAFDEVSNQGNQFIFTRAGSSFDQAAYGSLTFHRPVTVKVVVTTQPLNADSMVVACNAWIIASENDATFQEIHPVRSFGRQPYEDLLKKVQAELGE